jgi:RHS repeat-associated protein
VPNRHATTADYRYGFNDKERDDEIKGEGVQYDYGFRIYDARIGKFLSTDPLAKNFPWYTPYQFAGNKPTSCIDIDGLEEAYVLVLKYYENGEADLYVRRAQDKSTMSNGGKLLINYLGFPKGSVVSGLNDILVGFTQSELMCNPSADCYNYTLNLSTANIVASQSRIFDSDSGLIEKHFEYEHNGDKQEIQTRTGADFKDSQGFTAEFFKIKTSFKLKAVSQSNGYAGYDTAEKYINGILKPTIEDNDNKLKLLNQTRKDVNHILATVDKSISNNPIELKKVTDFLKNNYPDTNNIEINGSGPGITIEAIDVNPADFLKEQE